MADLINDFSWSKTREDCFQRCRRQYWFTYYGSWQGWDKKADPRVRTAYVLKQLKSRQMWSGEIVHRCIQWALNTLRTTGDMPAEESALHNVLRRMQRDFQESGEGLYWDKPKEHCALREHEYDEDIDDELWQAVMQHAANCVTHFYQSDILQHIRRLAASDWLEMEKLSFFMVDDIKVWVQLDFAHRNTDGGITIYDWKTGKADKPATREQLASYILYAAQQWRVPTEQITACEFHLPGKKVYETKLTTADLALVQDQIRVAGRPTAGVAQPARGRFSIHRARSGMFTLQFPAHLPPLCRIRRVIFNHPAQNRTARRAVPTPLQLRFIQR